jgi:hypothetical protein
MPHYPERERGPKRLSLALFVSRHKVSEAEKIRAADATKPKNGRKLNRKHQSVSLPTPSGR